MSDAYDAGYLPDDADCDQDSIRVELAYSHDFYTAVIEGQEERIAELEISLIYAEDFNSAALENLMRSGSIAIIEAVWEGGMLCPKIIMLDYEQSHSIRNYLHI
tara:strand:+ start:102 stop:413 length:312 start_codon:yes stop_codon:yes gene_type:complete